MNVISQSSGGVNIELTPRLIFFYATAGHSALAVLYVDEQLHPLDFDLPPLKLEGVEVNQDAGDWTGRAHLYLEGGSKLQVNLTHEGVIVDLWGAGEDDGVVDTFGQTFEELMPEGELLPDFGAMTLDELEEEARDYLDALQGTGDPYATFCEQLELEPGDDSRAVYERAEACVLYLEGRLGGDDPVYALCYPPSDDELVDDEAFNEAFNEALRRGGVAGDADHLPPQARRPRGWRGGVRGAGRGG